MPRRGGKASTMARWQPMAAAKTMSARREPLIGRVQATSAKRRKLEASGTREEANRGPVLGRDSSSDYQTASEGEEVEGKGAEGKGVKGEETEEEGPTEEEEEEESEEETACESAPRSSAESEAESDAESNAESDGDSDAEEDDAEEDDVEKVSGEVRDEESGSEEDDAESVSDGDLRLAGSGADSDGSDSTVDSDGQDSDDSELEIESAGRGATRAGGDEDENSEDGDEDEDEEEEEGEEEGKREREGLEGSVGLSSLPHDREVLRTMMDACVEFLKKGGVQRGLTREKDAVRAARACRLKVKHGRTVTRADIRKHLSAIVCKYYGYNEQLAEYFLDLFGAEKAHAFFEANEAERPLVLRTNNLKTRRKDLAQALIARGANVDPLGPWSKHGLIVRESSVPIGATPEYLGGHYMLQAASSFLPVLALDAQPNDMVLDVAAAPGGKSTFLAQQMRNSGVLFCNDANKQRTFALAANLHRLGVRNSIVINFDGRELAKHLPLARFDRILLDAPCSGSGVISKDQSVKYNKTPADFQKLARLQRELLVVAADLLNADSSTQHTRGLGGGVNAGVGGKRVSLRGGTLVYSTCSVSVEENEQVVDYILKVRKLKLVDTGLNFGVPGFTRFKEHRFDPSLALTRRFTPHDNNMDGFFVAKFVKYSNEIPVTQPRDRAKCNPFVVKK